MLADALVLPNNKEALKAKLAFLRLKRSVLSGKPRGDIELGYRITQYLLRHPKDAKRLLCYSTKLIVAKLSRYVQ